MVTEDFDAEKWSGHVIRAIGGKGSSPKGQDPKLNYNIRSRKLVNDSSDSIQQQALSLATQYAKSRLL
jgi:hypothetical protein